MARCTIKELRRMLATHPFAYRYIRVCYTTQHWPESL